MMTRFRGNGESALTERVAKSRYKMVYNPNAYVYHVIPANRLTIDFYKRRAFLQGVSNSYTILRGSGSIDRAASDGYDKELSPSSLCSKVFALLKCMKHGKTRFVECYRYYTEVRNAYKDGLLYHRGKVERDARLLDWIPKENYFDVGANSYLDTTQTQA